MSSMFGGACLVSTLSVLVLYYSLVSSEVADMETSKVEMPHMEESRQKLSSGLQQLELSEAQDKIKILESKLAQLEARLPTTSSYPDIKFRTYKDRKRILITGGAGFVGSHLVDKLMLDGHEVFVVDNYFTGSKRNIEQWLGHENFEIFHHDIVNPLFLGKTYLYIHTHLFISLLCRG